MMVMVVVMVMPVAPWPPMMVMMVMVVMVPWAGHDNLGKLKRAFLARCAALVLRPEFLDRAGDRIEEFGEGLRWPQLIRRGGSARGLGRAGERKRRGGADQSDNRLVQGTLPSWV
jgi:hypothetical protein